MLYQANSGQAAYLLFDVLQAQEQLRELPSFAELDKSTLVQVLEEAAKFASDKIAPLNASGDAVGAQLQGGQVTMPPGFAAAYQEFWQAGWPALSVAPEDGGQGLPEVFNQIMYEWLSAANHGWTMAPGLLHGAYECIKHHASSELKAQYLEKVGSGQWLATMCLTEAHAGSDLGQVRTSAKPHLDGSYLVSGTKIFISGGEHDLTENIVHLVLARLPDAPPGPKGLSLFLVPKFYPDGTRSRVVCERIEEKMGIHASPTCVLRFDEARAHIVGEPGKGLGAMFVMMNAARLHVALQGTGLLDAALQKASAYAQERRQMRAPPRVHIPVHGNNIQEQKNHSNMPTAGVFINKFATDLIVNHPTVQRTLETQTAYLQGLRVLAYQTALELDVAKLHPSADRRAQAASWCALATPVLKALCTDQGFRGISECLQVFGGHGYVREWGVEQHLRDARIAMIYEGTNEIQAIDLLIRKTLPDGGAALAAVFQRISTETPAVAAEADAVMSLARELASRSQAAPDLPYWVAQDFLKACGLVLLHWALQRLKQAKGDADQTDLLVHYQRWIAPELAAALQIIRTQCAAAQDLQPA
jgi:alkylation response protein AidB-like acyl-CoA dehydrogenase